MRSCWSTGSPTARSPPTPASRAPDRWSVIGATDFLARSFTWHAPGLAAARGLGLAALQAMPFAKRAFARQMMFGWR